MRRLIALCALALAATPAFAAEKPAEGGADASARQMLANNIVTPVVRDGKLVNYLFVTVQVDLADGANVLKLRDRAHFLRDSLLRAAHRTMLADPVAMDKLDQKTALATYRAAAAEALGAENIKAVSILTVDTLRRTPAKSAMR